MSVKRNIMNVVAGLLVALVLVSIGGCGGGTSAAPAPPTAPTSATLKLSINNLPALTKVGALQVHFNLPAGVVPTTLSGSDASGSIALGGDSTFSQASFVSPVVTIGVISGTGLSGGQFATMACSISPVTTVSLASFTTLAAIDSADDTSLASLVGTITVPIAVTLN